MRLFSSCAGLELREKREEEKARAIDHENSKTAAKVSKKYCFLECGVVGDCSRALETRSQL